MEMMSVDDVECECGLWYCNLIVLWFCMFVVGMVFSEIMLFFLLFVSQLGDFMKVQIIFYSGLVFVVDYVILVILVLLWGIIVDKKGCKIMLLCVFLGMVVVMGLMGFVMNVW